LKIAIFGAGNLGLALADYQGFQQEGFQIAALSTICRQGRSAIARRRADLRYQGTAQDCRARQDHALR
jgi:NADH/NAD ratio-sensing transcriptional regulator Rex